MKNGIESYVKELDALLVAITGDDKELDEKQYELCKAGEMLNKPLYVIISSKADSKPLGKFKSLRLLFTVREEEKYAELAGEEIIDCVIKDMRRIGLDYLHVNLGINFP